MMVAKDSKATLAEPVEFGLKYCVPGVWLVLIAFVYHCQAAARSAKRDLHVNLEQAK